MRRSTSIPQDSKLAVAAAGNVDAVAITNAPNAILLKKTNRNRNWMTSVHIAYNLLTPFDVEISSEIT
jgi:hypothetical protein